MAYAEDVELLNVVAAWDYREATDAPVDVLVPLLAVLRRAKNTLADADRLITNQLGEVQGRGLHVSGGVPYQVSTSKHRTGWKHDDLRRAVIVELAKRHDGDVTLVERIISDWLQCAGAASWKITGLKALGLDPEEFAHSAKTTTTVTLP